MDTILQIKATYSPKDVKSYIMKYNSASNPRYESFDYCYEYFHTQSNLTGNNMRQSCNELWSYLASWGMLRGSSSLLQRGNYKSLEGTITVIQNYFNNPKSLPDIKKDLRKNYVEKVVNLCKEIKGTLKGFNPTNTLITKIILGVFGVFPAIDQYFRKTFDASTSSNIRAFAELVWDLYGDPDYKKVLNGIKIPVKSFDGCTTRLYYPIAKLIDMFGFTCGMSLPRATAAPRRR